MGKQLLRRRSPRRLLREMIAICVGCCASSPANDRICKTFGNLQDLRCTDIQSSLLAYLLPFCLELWCEDLRGTSDKDGGFVEHLYPVLADRAIFDKHLTSKQSAAVSEFMRQTILEEVDDQLGLAYQGSKARPYRWIWALTTYGVLLSDVDRARRHLLRDRRLLNIPCDLQVIGKNTESTS